MSKTTPKSPFGPRETQRILARRKKWVEALRSGKFKQTQGALKDDEGYCCLGVAQEVCKLKLTSSMDEYLHQMDAAKLGISTDTQKALATLNDEREKSFKAIARVIDRLPVEKEEG